ncbi:MAG: putative zinc-binding metallopeptidase, partial [Propionibacteriaceae bacterium]
TLQTAAAYGVGVTAEDLTQPFLEQVSGSWLPLTAGLNQINRSMGKPDLYPFVLSPAVLAKLAFVSDLVTSRS